MNNKKSMGVAMLFVLGMVVEPSLCLAGFTTLGPTPYTSVADSPFPVDGSNPNFYLEDFEDGQLNTLGIHQGPVFPPPFDEVSKAVVLSPGIATDSVDSDDGVIDGNGQSGHSLASGLSLDDSQLPPGYTFLLAFEFNEMELGYLPNAFGLVWTDGPAPGSLALDITTATGTHFLTTRINDLGDASRNGTTSDDIFFGLIADEGIKRVKISGGHRGLTDSKYIEIDHVQYGLVTPEPTSIFLLFTAMYGRAFFRGRRRDFVQIQ